MPHIKVVRPGAAFDRSDAEGRYWESDIVDVPLYLLYGWLGDYSAVERDIAWDEFFSRRLEEVVCA
ncbi:MAG: hypothetical protein WC169_05520 [Dehalococcoidia bacterium]|jgi:hypothetical protein